MLGFRRESQKGCGRREQCRGGFKEKASRAFDRGGGYKSERLEHWQRAAKENGVKIVSAGTQEQNGAAMGLSARAIVAVNDRQMKEAILARIE